MTSFHPEIIKNYKDQGPWLESMIRDAERDVDNAREMLAIRERQLEQALAALDTHQRLIAHMEATNAEAAELQTARAEVAAAALGEPVEGRDYREMPDQQITPRSLAEIQAIEAAEAEDKHDLASCRERLGACTRCGSLSHDANDCEAEL